MSIDRVRHGRQLRLPEIGEAGQERLAAGAVALAGAGDAREIEAAYLTRAGVRVVDDAEATTTEQGGEEEAKAYAAAVAALGLRDPAARDVAQGSLRALLAMRRLLGMPGGGES